MNWCTNIITICLLSWSLPLLTFIPVVHSSVHYCLSGNRSEELSPDYRLRECLGIKEYTAYRSKGASPTTVTVDIRFQYFDIMDVDQRLAWSPQFYEYIDEIYTDPNYIWKPEFIIQYNLLDRARPIDSQARIPNDADPIEWYKVYNSKTFCYFDYVRSMFFNGLVSFLTGVPLPASTYPPVQDHSAMFTFTPYPTSASSSSSGIQKMPSGSSELKKMEKIMGDIRQNLVGLVCGEHLAACDEQWRSLSRMVDRLAFEIFMLANVFMTAIIYLRL
ncbi:hypothetical protein HELRODRAFT_183645 [Helobdella robusta]|uniref:Neurotransmitter-gated ion-channel ligand-binding domain-containing protein n=1 Tax=Helobdella robusta TaxID=6412 RepID=T1FJZ6_HELRO|nr:hypothetical protein HELRODRAFT_183645 [Helobdella robusta]ESO10423.1 hypothetical protein HELRODRAFT_183645 [Helobdella robusta]